MIDKKLFFQKYNISQEQFSKTKLKWEDLIEIYSDYEMCIPKLESTAIFIFNNLMKTNSVHSVRYRIKEPEHLIEKIIRKKIEDKKRQITIGNYKTEVTDLIGLRALHLFKEDWFNIHEQILATWQTKENPIAYYRTGDSDDYINLFKEKGCLTKDHKYGYRSVHYVIETKPTKETYFAEIQVRTIFEEAWSEIDHIIRYPYHNDNKVFKEFLLILNRLAGSADEMGTFIKSLQHEIALMQNQYFKIADEKDKIIQELEDKVKKLDVKDQEINSLRETINRLRKDSFSPSEIALNLNRALENASSFSRAIDTSNMIQRLSEISKYSNNALLAYQERLNSIDSVNDRIKIIDKLNRGLE